MKQKGELRNLKKKKNKRIHKQTTAGVKYNNLCRRTNTSNQSGYNQMVDPMAKT